MSILSNMQLTLIKPTKNLEYEIVEYKQEHFEYGDKQIHGSGGLAYYDDLDEWFKHIFSIENNGQVNDIQTTTFFTRRIDDEKLVGCTKIHHSLTPDLASGGHIAYGIRPSERGKGYGKQQLQLILDYAKSSGMKSVIIACDKSNIASARTAMSCGGILTNEFVEDGAVKQHYHIKL